MPPHTAGRRARRARTDEAERLSRDAEAAGADALLIAPVSYTPLSQNEAFEHYRVITSATSLPLCIYNNPSNRYVNDEAIAQAVVGFLSQIGVEVTLVSRPSSQHSPLLVSAETDFYLFGWGVPTFDSVYNLNDLIHSCTGNYGAWNATGYANPEIDARIESIASEKDVEARDRTTDDLWRFVKDERLYLPLHNQVTAWTLRDGVTTRAFIEKSSRAAVEARTLEADGSCAGLINPRHPG